MRLIFDQGEVRLIAEHVLSLFAPSRTPTLPDAYRNLKPGGLENWTQEPLRLLIEEGRRRLDAANANFEAIRNRSQYLIATSLAVAGALIGQFDRIIGSVLASVVWVVGMLMLVLALLLSFATFSSTAHLGSVDPVLLSKLDGRDDVGVLRPLARAYVKAFSRSTTAVNARFTLYRDAVWFLVIGIGLGAAAWALGGFGP